MNKICWKALSFLGSYIYWANAIPGNALPAIASTDAVPKRLERTQVMGTGELVLDTKYAFNWIFRIPRSIFSWAKKMTMISRTALHAQYHLSEGIRMPIPYKYALQIKNKTVPSKQIFQIIHIPCMCGPRSRRGRCNIFSILEHMDSSLFAFTVGCNDRGKLSLN